MTDSADAALQSWAMWEYKTFCISPVDPAAQNGRFGACKTGYGGKLFDSSGAVMKERLRGLARTYAPGAHAVPSPAAQACAFRLQLFVRLVGLRIWRGAAPGRRVMQPGERWALTRRGMLDRPSAGGPC